MSTDNNMKLQFPIYTKHIVATLLVTALSLAGYLIVLKYKSDKTAERSFSTISQTENLIVTDNNDAGAVPTVNLSIKQDYTKQELLDTEKRLIQKLKADFGFTDHGFSKHPYGEDLYAGKDFPIRYDDEKLRSFHLLVHPFQGVTDNDGNFVGKEDLRDIYDKKIDLLHSSSEIVPGGFAAWVSDFDGTPFVFYVQFSSQRESTVWISQDYGIPNTNTSPFKPLLLERLLELFPPNNKLANQLNGAMAHARAENRGYAHVKVLKKITSDLGNTLTLTVYYQLRAFSHNCQGSFLKEIEGVSRTALLDDSLSCEVVITTDLGHYVYTNTELQKIGGMPHKWVSNDTISVFTDESDGEGIPGTGTAGLFNPDRKEYEQVLTYEQPVGRYREAYIKYGNEKLVLIDSPDFYNLYRVVSTRDLKDFISYPQYRSELMLIGTMSLASDTAENSKYHYIITVDKDKNIVFEFGVLGESYRRYTYVKSGGTINTD